MPKEIKKETVIKFSKKQFLSTKRYVNRKDLINVLVGEDEFLSELELQERIDSFMKGKVD